MGGGSRVSATTVMRSLRRCGGAIAASEREAARSLFSDGVAPEADTAAAHVLVGADGTYVTMRGGRPKAEVKAMVAYAGKVGSEGGRVSRVDPVRLGCVGVAPGEFWREAVAQLGTRFDLARVERVSLGTDGEAQYVNGIGAMSFAPEPDGHIGPFHVDRAVARCAPRDTRLGWALLEVLEAGGPAACAGVMGMLGAEGLLSEGWDGVAAYLRKYAAEIGGARPWAPWRPSSSTCTRSAWRPSPARGRGRAPTRWPGPGAGSPWAGTSPAGRARSRSRRRGGGRATRGSRTWLTRRPRGG